LATTGTNTLEASTASPLSNTAALATATEDGATTPTESTLSGSASVVNDGEGRFIFGNLDGEQARGAGTVDLLV
jgi:hypothetical protein